MPTGNSVNELQLRKYNSIPHEHVLICTFYFTILRHEASDIVVKLMLT